MLYDLFDHRERAAGFRWLTPEEESRKPANLNITGQFSERRTDQTQKGVCSKQAAFHVRPHQTEAPVFSSQPEELSSRLPSRPGTPKSGRRSLTMLLKHLYDFAVSRKLLDDLAFSPKAVRWIIELNAEGKLVGNGSQVTGDDKRGKEYACPQTTRAKVAGGVSEFLADGITAVFGLDSDPSAEMTEKKRLDRDANNAAKRGDFWAQIEAAFEATQAPELKALLAFGAELLRSQVPSFLRWGTLADAKVGAKPSWLIPTAMGSEVRLGAETLRSESRFPCFWKMKS